LNCRSPLRVRVWEIPALIAFVLHQHNSARKVNPGGTPLTPRADQRAAPGETRIAAARSPGSSLCCPPDSRPSVSRGNMVTHGTSSKPIKRHANEIGLHVYPEKLQSSQLHQIQWQDTPQQWIRVYSQAMKLIIFLFLHTS